MRPKTLTVPGSSSARPSRSTRPAPAAHAPTRARTAAGHTGWGGWGPRGLAVHPRNIRDDLGDLSGLADSIAAQGVLEALTVIPHAPADGTPGHQIFAGHRRAAAAILAGLTTVPCVLRPDLALDTWGRCWPRTCTARA